MLGPNTVASNYSRYLNYTANCVFNFGLQAGFSILLVVTLLALTRPSKRRTPIFLINIFALTACIARVILQACYFWSNSWAYFIQVIVLIDGDVEYNDWRADDPYTWRGQMVAAFFAGLQSTCIFVSLYLQIKAVCAPMVVRWQQTSMMALTGFIAFANIFLAWLHTGLQMQALGDLVSSHGERWSFGIEYVGLWQLISWVNQGSVAFFSLIFAAKLAVAVVQRRRLGIKQFGAMEIVLIMALETMLVPGKSNSIPSIHSRSSLPFHLTHIHSTSHPRHHTTIHKHARLRLHLPHPRHNLPALLRRLGI